MACCRSTGEFPSMTLAERKHAAELCRAHWPGTVVVGVSSTAVADCIELLEHASTQVTTANNVSALYQTRVSLLCTSQASFSPTYTQKLLNSQNLANYIDLFS